MSTCGESPLKDTILSLVSHCLYKRPIVDNEKRISLPLIKTALQNLMLKKESNN